MSKRIPNGVTVRLVRPLDHAVDLKVGAIGKVLARRHIERVSK